MRFQLFLVLKFTFSDLAVISSSVMSRSSEGENEAETEGIEVDYNYEARKKQRKAKEGQEGVEEEGGFASSVHRETLCSNCNVETV